MPFAIELVALRRNFPEEYGTWTGRRIGKALVLTGVVDVPTLLKRRNVAICFPGPPSKVRPIVMVSGPTTSRHRFVQYRPTSLCLYYYRDPASMRWDLRSGLAGLIDLIRQHLFKEEWWRATNKWVGAQVHLDPAPARPGVGRRSERPRAVLQRKRQPCWCGHSRYASCHGALPEMEESRLLGIETNPPAVTARGTGTAVTAEPLSGH
jgi:hypothetical protein